MSLAISAAAFYIFASIFARELLNSSRWKVVTLAFVFTFLTIGTRAFGPSIVVSIAYLVALAAVVAATFRLWLKATWPQSVKIAGSFVGFNVAYTLGWLLLYHVAVN